MKVIITGTTGMVGEGVLIECLKDSSITEVLGVSRKPSGIVDTKLKEYIVPDFLTLKENDPSLRGFDTCFFCAGATSVGKKEDEYRRLTYDTTLNFANALSPKSNMTFFYISGAGTDSTEKGKLMWARVKGKTENDLQKLGFKQVFAVRPGLMKYTKGQIHVSGLQKAASGLFPFFNTFFPKIANTIEQLGRAMINAAQQDETKTILEVSDIRKMGR